MRQSWGQCKPKQSSQIQLLWRKDSRQLELETSWMCEHTAVPPALSTGQGMFICKEEHHAMLQRGAEVLPWDTWVLLPPVLGPLAGTEPLGKAEAPESLLQQLE